MSQADTNAESEFTQTTVEQDTILTIYGAEASEYENAREFIADLFDGPDVVDVLKEESETERKVELNVHFEEEIDTSYGTRTVTVDDTISPFGDDSKTCLVNNLDVDDLPDGIELVDETIEDTFHPNSVRQPLKDLVPDLVNASAIIDRGFEPEQYSLGVIGWTRNIDDLSVDADPDSVIQQSCYVSISSSSSIKPRDVLRHKDDRSQHKTFEEGEQRWSAQVTVHLEGTESDEVTGMARGLIPSLQMDLSAIDDVYDVRLKSCEKETSEVGDCYQI